MARDAGGEERAGVPLTNLDQPLFDGAGATKRDLVDYLDGVRDRLLPELAERPLSVIRVHRGQDAFMQKNVPKGTPDWVRTVGLWAETSKREVHYAVCDDRRTLVWFANQRAVEFHPSLARLPHLDRPTHLVIDLDPPEGDGFKAAVAVVHLVRQVLDDAGLAGAVKTSGAKGLHVFIPVEASVDGLAAAHATRALAARVERLDPSIATTAFVKDDREGKVFVDSTRGAGSTVVSAYSPRLRAGVPVSFPVAWADVDDVSPSDFTIANALDLLGDRDPWAEAMPAPLPLPGDLVAEGGELPVPRVAAMHEGKRRKRAKAAEPGD